MKKFAVFSNYGPWDNDNIGFIGFVDQEDDLTPDQRIRDALILVTGGDEQYVIEEVEVLTGASKDHLPESYWEVNLFVKPDFDLESLVKIEDHWDCHLCLIEVK